MSAQWFVVRAIAGQEKKVKTYIESEIERLKMHAYVHQLLIPMEKVMEIKEGKKTVKERSYLPGYIFINAEVRSFVVLENKKERTRHEMQPEVFSMIKDVPGVVGFLGTEKGKTPVPLREDEVKKLLGKVDELTDSEETLIQPFLVGENVKVMDGPFSGFTATIDEVQDDRKKLKVIVKIFGRNTPLELNYIQVERLS